MKQKKRKKMGNNRTKSKAAAVEVQGLRSLQGSKILTSACYYRLLRNSFNVLYYRTDGYEL